LLLFFLFLFLSADNNAQQWIQSRNWWDCWIWIWQILCFELIGCVYGEPGNPKANMVGQCDPYSSTTVTNRGG
jgi:hypothetical protein